MATAQEFMDANDKSPVVKGRSIGGGGQGGVYTLRNGKEFRLDVTEARKVNAPYPKWDFTGVAQ